MLTLTVSQPYASLIADGKKVIENRTWWTPHRGNLLIHAGSGQQYCTRKELKRYPTGKILAVCKLTHVCRPRDLHQFHPHLIDDDDAIGPWCWIICHVKKLENPIVTPGDRGLWEFPVNRKMLIGEFVCQHRIERTMKVERLR